MHQAYQRGVNVHVHVNNIRVKNAGPAMQVRACLPKIVFSKSSARGNPLPDVTATLVDPTDIAWSKLDHAFQQDQRGQRPSIWCIDKEALRLRC